MSVIFFSFPNYFLNKLLKILHMSPISPNDFFVILLLPGKGVLGVLSPYIGLSQGPPEASRTLFPNPVLTVGERVHHFPW